jgi:hypothetical protein
MTRTTNPGPRPVRDDGTTDLNTTLGADLLLTERADGSLELYTFDGRDARALGTYADAASAWRAVDALDAEELGDDELAA